MIQNMVTEYRCVKERVLIQFFAVTTTMRSFEILTRSSVDVVLFVDVERMSVVSSALAEAAFEHHELEQCFLFAHVVQQP